MLFTTIAISSLGFLQTANAQTLQMALFANQITYLGASFTPLFMLICFADLCKFKINKLFALFCILCALGIFICTSTVEYVPFYYKKFWIVEKFGITILKKEYGFLHKMYYIYIICTNIFGCFIIIKSFTRQQDVSFITSSLLLLSMILSAVGFLIQKVLHLSVSIVPVSNLVSEFFIFILLTRIRLYDIKKIASDFYTEAKTTGLILFDKNNKYLGSDDIAKFWFPEIQKLKLDQTIKNEQTEFLKKISEWQLEKETDTVPFECGDIIVGARKFELKKKAGRLINVIYLSDITQQQKYTQLVENYSKHLEAEVAQKTEKLFQIQNDILRSMANIVEDRDNNTGGHIARTSDVMRIFVTHLKEKSTHLELTDSFAECVIKAAPLHDFGKIAIPDVILNKPGKFTDEEYEKMKEHSTRGAVIVNQILNNANDPFFKLIAVNVAHYHHEKWNGEGYPEKLKETEIPFEARIMALADVFDALVSKRVYKESFDYDRAFSIMEDSCGSHFDPVLCREFIECRPILEKLYSSYEKDSISNANR